MRGRQQQRVLMPGLRGKHMCRRAEGKHEVVKSSVGLLVSHYCSIETVWMGSYITLDMIIFFTHLYHIFCTVLNQKHLNKWIYYG